MAGDHQKPGGGEKGPLTGLGGDVAVLIYHDFRIPASRGLFFPAVPYVAFGTAAMGDPYNPQHNSVNMWVRRQPSFTHEGTKAALIANNTDNNDQPGTKCLTHNNLRGPHKAQHNPIKSSHFKEEREAQKG